MLCKTEVQKHPLASSKIRSILKKSSSLRDHARS
jgi:hypothetical protein